MTDAKRDYTICAVEAQTRIQECENDTNLAWKRVCKPCAGLRRTFKAVESLHAFGGSLGPYLAGHDVLEESEDMTDLTKLALAGKLSMPHWATSEASMSPWPYDQLTP